MRAFGGARTFLPVVIGGESLRLLVVFVRLTLFLFLLGGGGGGC